MKNRTLLAFVVLCITAAIPFFAFAAGGAIEGKVIDPKGAPIVNGSIAVTDDINNRNFTATTDAQGHYKVEGLPPGTYTLIVSASGFSEFRKESIVVGDAAAITVDVKLEISSVSASVSVTTGQLKPNSDPVYQQLRQQARNVEDFTSYATVSNVVLSREGATFTLKNGEIYFLAPVQGRYTGAVFIGDGEFKIQPPTEREQESLKIFTNTPALTEQFSTLVLHFTDRTFDEIKKSAAAKWGTAGPQAGRARDLFRDNQELLRTRLRDNSELRVLSDLYAPERPGFFTAFINGSRFSKLVYLFSPLGIPEVSPEEVLLLSYGEGDNGFWTAFHRLDEYKNGTASSAEEHRIVDLVHHEINATIKGTRLLATDTVTLKSLLPGTRVLLLSLYPSLRVNRVLDEQGRELNFVQEAKDQDADFGIILPQALEVGKPYKITIDYDGTDALRDSGGGNFILIPRSTWYPNNAGTQFGDRATFDIVFHYPKGNTLVATGALTEPETRDGDQVVSKWSSGTTDLAVAGFNYGRFKKKELADKTGYNLEFYANEELPDEMKAVQQDIEQAEKEGQQTFTTLGAMSTTGIANAALADAQNATRIYTAFFGKLPYTRVAMSQQPAGFFGQAWPTLVFMPYTAFLDTTQRTQLFGSRMGKDTFWRYVGPHEIAHQWWGHSVGWDSYHDQWMSEGFAEFSASLYVQFVRKDLGKFIDFWEGQRKLIVDPSPATKDRRPYTVGPVTQGYRLNNAKTGSVARALIYPKGAYILHMIRMMMYDRQTGDARFQKMMKDFIQTHYNQDISTEDFKAIVEKHITKDMDLAGNGSMDWFFNEWVYGTEMPSYKFTYQVAKDGTLSGQITQSGVSNNFGMLVPLYADFGNGWIKLGMATMVGNSTAEVSGIKLPQTPKKVAICALNDVLAANIENAK